MLVFFFGGETRPPRPGHVGIVTGPGKMIDAPYTGVDVRYDSFSTMTTIGPMDFYGKTLVNPDDTDLGPRVGFAYAIDPQTAIRGGFGISYAHYTRAGSGDILAINAPQAQFAAVTQITPTTTNHCSTPLPAQIIATGT